MKLSLKIILIFSLLLHITVPGQEISEDSLLKKAKLEIYDNPDTSIKIINQLLKRKPDINKVIYLYTLISTANISKRNFDESLKYILKAKELAKKTDDPQTHATMLGYIAVQYQQMQLFSKSLETLDEADRYLAKIPDGSEQKNLEIARNNAIRGMIYKGQSNSEIALEKFFISVKNFEKVKSNKLVPSNLSVVYYNMGACYINLNQLDNARQAFLQSIEYAKKNDAKSLEAYALKGLAEVYKLKHDNQTALELLVKAEDLCKDTEDITLLEGTYKEMAENYLAVGHQKQYQIYNKKYNDMLFEREQNELSSINHTIDNHNKETLAKSKEIIDHYNYMIIVATGIGAILAALLLFLILKMRKQNKNYQKEIQQLIRS